MNIPSIFFSVFSLFQAYSLYFVVPTIIGLMVSVFLLRKNENYSFILLVLILSLLALFFIPSFSLIDFGIFSYLSESAGAIASFIVFILLNIFLIITYLFYKKIFSNKILIKYLALPIILIISAVIFSVAAGIAIGYIFFNSDNTGNFLGPIGGIFIAAFASIGFNLLLSVPIYYLIYRNDISNTKSTQTNLADTSSKFSFKKLIKSPIFIIVVLILLVLAGYLVFSVAKEAYYSKVTVVSDQNSWPTYKGNGYSFKYPPKGEVDSIGGSEDYGYEDEVWIETNVQEEGARDAYSIVLRKYKILGNENTIAEWWESEKDYFFEAERDLTSIKTTPDNINGYESLWVEIEGDDIVFLKKDDNIIMLDAMVIEDTRYDSKKETHDMLVRIVKTLKIE